MKGRPRRAGDPETTFPNGQPACLNEGPTPKGRRRRRHPPAAASPERLNEGPTPKGRRLAHQHDGQPRLAEASMKGRPRRAGDWHDRGRVVALGVAASMKGRPRRAGDATAHHRAVVPRGASMKGRPRRAGDLLDDLGLHDKAGLNEGPTPKGRRPRYIFTGWGQCPEASMKGRPRRAGDLAAVLVLGVEPVTASMKGRPRRAGDSTPPPAATPRCRLNEGPTPKGRRPAGAHLGPVAPCRGPQ